MTNNDTLTPNQLTFLRVINEKFARNFSASLSVYVLTTVEISLQNIEQSSYAEFLDTLSDPTCYTAISMKPSDGLAAIEMGSDLVFPMIDRLLGGAGRRMTATRPMTEIEQSIMLPVLKLMLDNLKEVWHPFYGIEFAVTDRETHPRTLQITEPRETVVRFQFQVQMRDIRTKMHLVIPTLVLAPIIYSIEQKIP